MKIRTDFVTNSSSASFILELTFEAEDGASVKMNLAVSPEVCFSDDGDMQGEDIYLDPEDKNGDILVGGKSIYSAKDMDELCDTLFEAAVIDKWHAPECIKHWDLDGLIFAMDGDPVYYESKEKLAAYIEEHGGKLLNSVTADTQYLISNDRKSTSNNVLMAKELGIPIIREANFMYAFDEENCNYDDLGISVSVKEAAPITIGKFKTACIKTGIIPDTLKTIIVKNSKFGFGDSAMWIDCDNDQFKIFRGKYMNTIEEEKTAVLEELITFVKSEPELEVCDNEGYLPDRMCCVWNRDEDALRKSMSTYMEGKVSHWMGTYTREFTIDVTGRNMTSREVLYFGDI